MSPRPVLLVRHGQSHWNVENRFQGQTDIDLTPQGVAEAATLARSLPALLGSGPAHVVSSDLNRARRTAEAIGDRLETAPAVDSRLREIDAGSWQGLSHEEIQRQDPDAYRRWRGGEEVHLGGAERPVDAGARVAAAVEQRARETAPGWLVVVGHGSSLRAAVAVLLDLPGLGHRLGPLGNACTAYLTRHAPGRWSLVHWNAPPGGPSPAVSSLRPGSV